LTRQHRVEDAAEFRVELSLRPLGVELRVVRHLHGARRGEQLEQRRERGAVGRAVACAESVEVDDVGRTVGRGELHEPHAPAIRIERSGFRVETDGGVLGQFGDRRREFRRVFDETIVG
jgi:hypothetical protein